MGGITLAFGVVSPWLLAAGLALGFVPLLIHLLHRRQHVERPWAAMQYLQAAIRVHSRRLRLESLLLLCVRTALILLAATALAQPFLEQGRLPLLSGGGVHHVLVIDTSLSMGADTDSDSALQRARRTAEQIVKSSTQGDSFSLVRICRTEPLAVIAQPATNRELILSQIQSLETVPQRGDVAGALREAMNCLDSGRRETRREVLILSDFQATNWLPSDSGERQTITDRLSQLAETAELTLISVAGESTDNLAITDLAVPREITALTPRARADVTLFNSGTAAVEQVPVEIFAAGRLVGSGPADVPAGESVTITVPLEIESGGVAVSAVIPEDALAADNRRFSVLPAAGPLEVLLVSGYPRTSDHPGAADFVQLALAPETQLTGRDKNRLAATVIADADLRNSDLTRFDCVILCDVALVDADEAARLRAYVEAGGGLVVALGEHVEPAAYAQLAPSDGPGLLPGTPVQVIGDVDPEREPYRFEPGEYAHRIIQPFSGNPDAGLLTTEVYRYWRMSLPDDSPADVALSYSTGDPAIVESRVGSGRVLVVTTPLDDRWSNWALWPSFVPLVHELVQAAIAGADVDRHRLVGDTIVRRFTPEQYSLPVKYAAPGAEPITLTKTARGDGVWTATVRADSVGLHALQMGTDASRTEYYAVNIDPEESRLTSLEHADIAGQLLPEGGFRFLTDWRPRAVRDRLVPKAGLSRWLLLAVLALLLVEQVMAWNFRFGFAALLLAVIGGALITMVGRVEWIAISFIALLIALLMMPAFRRVTAWRRPRSRASES